jgi:hypothetical protein
VSETVRCPHCGSPVPGATEPGPAASGLEPLYREVRRIREIAESRTPDDDARRIADLTRQVQELRATVARLRGPGAAVRVPSAGKVPGRQAS